MAEESQQSKKGKYHTWTALEDRVLVECLIEIGPSWKGDNGFKPGFANQLEKMMLLKIPGCTLKATPHIFSRIKHLKKHYNAICEMTSATGGSGFGWNDKDKMIDVEKEIYDEWVKTHPNAKGLYKKPFPFFEELGAIFGKDVATGQDAETPAEADEELTRGAAMFTDSQFYADDFIELMGDTTQLPVNEAPILETAPEENMVSQSVGSTAAAKKGKKRGRTEDPLEKVVSEAVDKLTQSHANTGEKIDKLVSSIGYKQQGREIRMTLLDELKKIEGLTKPQRVKVAMIMGKDSELTDIFMSGDYEDRVLVVESVLESGR